MKFKREATLVDAVQFSLSGELPPGVTKDEAGYYVDTLDGKRHVSPGDWVVIGPGGTRYVIEDATFRANYSLVEE